MNKDSIRRNSDSSNSMMKNKVGSLTFNGMLPSWERYISIALFIFCDH